MSRGTLPTGLPTSPLPRTLPLMVETVSLTDRFIKGLEPTGQRREIRDTGCQGLRLRVGTSGDLSWSVILWTRQGARRTTIGKYPGMTLAKARKRALDLRDRASSGQELAISGPKGSGPSLIQIVRSYAEANATRVGDSQREHYHQTIKKLLLWRPAQDRPVVDLSPVEIERFFLGLASKTPVLANRVFTVARIACLRAAKFQTIQFSPMAPLSRPAKERSRERVLDPSEIKALWNGMAAEGYEAVSAFVLLLYTGTRTKEWRLACGEEFKDGLWLIPKARRKNQIDLLLPLVGAAQLVPSGPGRLFGLPAPTNSRSWWGRAARRAGLTDVRPHDVRRTVGTGITSLGFSRFVMQRVLGHTEGGVASVYDRYSYLKEKREALNAWSKHLCF